MFVMTMNRTMLRRIGAVAACAAVLTAGVLGLKAMGNDAVEAAASPVAGLNRNITGAQDLQAFLAGYGIQADPAAAEVSQVKIPRKWDESFQVFHEVIKQSGLDLSKCKNRTVDKWVVPVPAQSNEATQTYAVVIVYKEEAKGAYLLQKPSGEVLPLKPSTAAPAVEQSVQQSAAAPEAVSPVPSTTGDTTQQPSQPSQAMRSEEAGQSTEVLAQMSTEQSAVPTE